MKQITFQAVAALALIGKAVSMLQAIAGASGWNSVVLFIGAVILGGLGLRFAWCFDVGVARYKNWA